MIRHFSLLAALTLSFIGLSSCNQTIEVQDGRLPPEYLAAAQAWVGTYQGEFNGNSSVTLSLAVDGYRPVVQVNSDLVGEGCHSQIGELKSITLEKSDSGQGLAILRFKLDPGSCGEQVWDRELRVKAGALSGAAISQVQLTYIHDWYLEKTCDPAGEKTVCRQDSVPLYRSGTLVRAPGA